MKSGNSVLLITVVLLFSLFLYGCDGGTASSLSESSNSASGSESMNDNSESSSEQDSSQDSSGTSSEALTGELGDIMQYIIDNATSKLEYIKDMTLVTSVITDEFKQYFLGSSDVAMTEGLALEPEISSPFSVCLIKVPDDVDVEEVKDMIATTVDPMKWICMGVDPSNVLVESEGNIVILIMTDNGGAEIYEAFKASFN